MCGSIPVSCQGETTASIPLLASAVKAGFPSPAESFVEKSLDFNTLLILDHASTYALRVSGTSMVNAGILPGAIVIVDRALPPKHESVVVAEIDGEFTIKRLLKTGSEIILHAENPEYPDIELCECSNVTIWGVVTWVLHQP